MSDVVAHITFNKDKNWFTIKEGVKADDIIEIAKTKVVFRNLKRVKKTYRQLSDIMLCLDEDETAVVSCCLQKSKLIVWHITVIRTPIDEHTSRADLAYICVNREGVYCYPPEKIRELLKKENEKIPVLHSWKEDQEMCKHYLDQMIQSYKDYNRILKEDVFGEKT